NSLLVACRTTRSRSRWRARSQARWTSAALRAQPGSDHGPVGPGYLARAAVPTSKTPRRSRGFVVLMLGIKLIGPGLHRPGVGNALRGEDRRAVLSSSPGRRGVSCEVEDRTRQSHRMRAARLDGVTGSVPAEAPLAAARGSVRPVAATGSGLVFTGSVQRL